MKLIVIAYVFMTMRLLFSDGASIGNKQYIKQENEDETLRSLLNITFENEYIVSTLHYSYSITFVHQLSNDSQLSYITAYTHMRELCPLAHKNCWCGFVHKFWENNTVDFSYWPLTITKICSLQPNWLENKEELVREQIDALRIGNSPNCERCEASQIVFDTILNETSGKRILDHPMKAKFASIEPYTHQEQLCDPALKWCWCGLIHNLKDYQEGIETTGDRSDPFVMVDCRVHEKRPFEKRNCESEPGANKKISIFRLLFGSVPQEFPCGFYPAY